MARTADQFLASLSSSTPAPIAPARPVPSQDKTAAKPAPSAVKSVAAGLKSSDNPVFADATCGVTTSTDIDTLFGSSKAYREFQREKPEHRLMLWHRLRGLSVKETALAMGYTPGAVYEVCGQPWFKEAFARLSTELGKDCVTTFLEGEVSATLETLVKLRDDTATPAAVRKSVCDTILDRIRGKPVTKSEMKVTGQVDNVVYDAAKLLEEERRLAEQLRSRGIGIN